MGNGRETDGGVEADWGRDMTRSQVITPVSIHYLLLIHQSLNFVIAVAFF